MGTMVQNEKMPQRYFNHGSPKDQPKFWWYFRFIEIGSKVGFPTVLYFKGQSFILISCPLSLLNQ